MQTVGILTVNTVNDLYNNSLTKFMDIQIAVNEGKLRREQARRILINTVSITERGFKAATRMAVADSKWTVGVQNAYENEFKELIDQMQEYLQTELNSTRSL